tara:strand:- start:31409 stop:38968 length:7560 start_codon:yes stop_codon:yes gene_type:complete
VLVLVGMMGLNGSVIGQDMWEWSANVSGTNSYEIIDIYGSQLLSSPSSTRPDFIRFSDGSEISMRINSQDNYCESGSSSVGQFSAFWSVKLLPQKFYEPSEIPLFVCIDERVDLSIKNDGLNGSTYSFSVNHNGIRKTFIPEISSSPPQYDFSFEFTEASLVSLFGFANAEEIFGTYYFDAVVETCSSESYSWPSITFYAPAPEVNTITTTPPTCPGGSNGKIGVYYQNVYPNIDFVFTVVQLLKGEGGSNVEEDWVKEINCDDPNVWCGGEYDLSEWDRNHTGNSTAHFDQSGSVFVEIDPGKFLDAGQNALTLPAGLYAMRIESSNNDEILCDKQYFIEEIPEQEKRLTFGDVQVLSDEKCNWEDGSVLIPDISWRDNATDITYLGEGINSGPLGGSFSIDEIEGSKLYIEDLKADNYIIHLNDGCSDNSDDISFEIEKETDFFSLIETVNIPASCLNETGGNGRLTIEGSQNTEPFTWFLDNEEVDQVTSVANFENLSNQFTVSAIYGDKDGKHCIAEVNYDLALPGDLNVTPQVVQPTCHGLGGALILSDISKSNGEINFKAMLRDVEDSNPTKERVIETIDSSVELFTDVLPGNYELTITDLCGNNASKRYSNQEDADYHYDLEFVDPPKLDLVIAEVNKLNCADDNGIVHLEIENSDEDVPVELRLKNNSFDYSWNIYTTEKRITIDTLLWGVYDIEIIETEGCGDSDSDSFEINVLGDATEPISYEASIDYFSDDLVIGCKGGTNNLEILVSGGLSSYVVTLLDSNDDAIVLSTEAATDDQFESCGDACFKFKSLVAGQYYIEISDDFCTKSFKSSPIDFNEPDKALIINPINDIHFDQDQVNLDQDGNLMIKCHGETVNFVPELETDYQGGTGELTTKLELERESVPFTNLGPGTYTFTVTDENDCSVSKQFELREPEEFLSAEVTPKTWPHGKHIKCVEDDNGKITVSISGGIPPYDFAINGVTEATDDPDGNWTFSELSAESPQTSYTIVVTDYLGCDFEQIVNLEPPTKPRLEYSIVSDVVGEYEIPCTGASATIRFTGSSGYSATRYRLQIDGEIVGFFDHDGTLEWELTSGNYRIRMLDSLNCDSDEFELDLTEPDEPLSFTTTAVHPNCIGGEDGSITIETAGGVPTYLYSLDGISWQEENLFPGIESGEYEVFVKDNNECTTSKTVIVPDNPNPLTISHTSTNPPSCHHGTDGSITVQTSNFRLKDGNKLSYFISGGHYGDEVIEVVAEVDPIQENHFITFENLWDTKDTDFVTHNYEIWVEDFYECVDLTNQFIGNLALIAPDPIRLNVEITAPSCYNGENGWFEITVQGGVSPYEFSLDNLSFVPSNTSDNSKFIFSDLSAGDYIVFVRDANFQSDQPSCLSTLDVHVPQGFDIEAIEDVQNLSCVGGNDGSIEVDIQTLYKNNPFEYEADRLDLEWFFGSNPLSEGSSLANLSKGVYTLKMSYNQDSLVCREQRDIPVMGPNTSLSIASIKTYPTSCGEENDGRAIVNFTGGWTDSTTYYNLDDDGWNPVLGSSIVINDLSIGRHNIKIGQSGFNCQDETTFVINKSGINIDTVFYQAPTCSAGSNGTIILKASNATEPRFLIADSSYYSTSGTYSGLSSGKTYNLVVIDEANPLCISDTISFSFPDCEDDTEDVVITGIPTIQPATCESAVDGKAQVITTGGLPPYNYMLDGEVVLSANLSDLSYGIHEVIVTDDLGKKDTSEFIMVAESSLTISSISTTKSTCVGDCDGSAIIFVEGGSGSNYIKWEDDFVGHERGELCPGVYSFQVMDKRNEACLLNGEVNVSAYEPLAIEVIQLTKPTCHGGNNGKLSVIGAGGSGSYSFEWENGSAKSVLENISAGTYAVTLTDNLLNCSVVEEIELPDIPAILVSDTILGIPSCKGSTDGSIELVLENAVSPLVEWDDGAIGLFRKNLSAGTYHFTVTASNSCQISGEIELPGRDPLAVEVSKTDNHCYGFCEGTIDLSIFGGLAPYYIEWGSGLKSLHLNQLCNGVYEYQVVDRLGCVVAGSVEIRSPDPLAIELIEKKDVSCRGFGDGTLGVAATGGTGTYSYQWNSGNETQSIEGLQPGNYTVSVSDENGCSTTTTYTITQPQSIFLKKETIVDPSCDGKNDGQIEVLAAGGNSSYQYIWDDLSTGPFINELYEGSYQLMVEDDKGCNYSKTFKLKAPPPLSLVNVQYQDPICFDESSGLISTEVIGGKGPYAYSWSSGQSSSTIENLPHGEYELTVTDENGCVIASSFELSNPEPISIKGIEELVMLCEGGSVFMSPDGAWDKYVWLGPSGFSSGSSRIEVSLPGEYTLSVQNEDGCAVSQSFSIEWSESILDADFIRISEAVVNEPLIFVDLSLPVPDEVEWVVPESENIIVTSMDDQFIEVVFTEPGAYELGLVAYYQSCIAELFKTIEIEAGSGESTSARVADIDAIYTSVYPNPSQGNLDVIVNADTKDQLTVKLLDMTRDELVHEDLSGKLDYLLHWDLTEIPSGVYFLVVQAGKNVQQKRILMVR